MKPLFKLLFISVISIILASGCEKTIEKAEEEEEIENFSSCKIIKHTCSGTVLQLLNSNDSIGEPWRNFMVYYGEPVITYPDCVLAGNLQIFLNLSRS